MAVYPSQAEVDQSALLIQTDELIVYAFAAQHARVPFQASEVRTFILQVEAWRQRGFRPVEISLIRAQPVMLYAYIQAHGGLPGDKAQLHRYLTSIGVLDSTGEFTGTYPRPGQGYPPGGLPPAPTVPGPVQVTNPLEPLLQSLGIWLRQNPLLAAGVGLGAFWILFGQKGRRRLF